MLRAFREAWVHRRLDETLAWSALATNLLVLPGLGSIMARRRVSGVLQAVLALAGTGLALYWLVSFVRLWSAEGSFPMDGGEDFGLGLSGVGIFGLGWLWSLVTSLLVLREVRRGPGPPA
jgi:hypothetical protein